MTPKAAEFFRLVAFNLTSIQNLDHNNHGNHDTHIAATELLEIPFEAIETTKDHFQVFDYISSLETGVADSSSDSRSVLHQSYNWAPLYTDTLNSCPKNQNLSSTLITGSNLQGANKKHSRRANCCPRSHRCPYQFIL